MNIGLEWTIWVCLSREERVGMGHLACLLGGSDGKESPPRNEEDLGSIPGLGRASGEGNGSPLQWRMPGESPWAEEPGGLQSTGSPRVRHWVIKHTALHPGASAFTCGQMVWRSAGLWAAAWSNRGGKWNAFSCENSSDHRHTFHSSWRWKNEESKNTNSWIGRAFFLKSVFFCCFFTDVQR